MESIRPALSTLRLAAPPRASRPLLRCLHTSASCRATPLPHPSVPGPPPETPTPLPSDALSRVERKRKQAELLKQAREIRTAPSKPKSVLQKRFWKDVTVKETEGILGLSTPPQLLLTQCRWPAGLSRQQARPDADQRNSHPSSLKAPARHSHCARVGPPPERTAGPEDTLHTHDLARRPRAGH